MGKQTEGLGRGRKKCGLEKSGDWSRSHGQSVTGSADGLLCHQHCHQEQQAHTKHLL